jgi:DNA recombination protein RmuC
MAFVYILLILILAALIFLVLKSKKETKDDLSQKLNEIFPEVLKNANQQLITLADQKIGTDLSNKKDSIEKMVKQVLDELTKNQSKLETAEKDRIGSFNGLKEAIDNNQKLTQQLKITADSLKNVLSNNQMRGAFGEKVAEDLLKQSGFSIGTDYTKQETTGESRPDFTIYLPDKTKINIDSKFPYANIVKMSETDEAAHKTQYLKLFEQDIKKKISDVSSRNYINPEDNTVDFVIVFIPNEMIFSFIYEKFPNILEEAFCKKIIFAGPFSFIAILRMVRQAYDNFRFQKDIQGIIAQIKIFAKEFASYNEEFTKIGDRIESLSKQYTIVNSTRTNKLVRCIDKINLEAPSDIKPIQP